MLAKQKIAWIYRQLFIRDWRKRIRQLSLKNTIPQFRPFVSTPLIIIGMHRSGTSLLTRLLHQCGIFMGSQRGLKTDEAVFFSQRNDAIFASVHGAWDAPRPAQELLAIPQWSNILARLLWEDCRSGKTISYVGRNSLKNKDQLDLYPTCWGWKDPRNTFTLPLWLQLFPNAKVLHIVRNGVDVSRSLQYRETILESHSDISLRSQLFSTAFELWAEYVEQACRMMHALPIDRSMTIQYEDLLIEPKTKLMEINTFVGNAIGEDKVRLIAESVRRDNAWVFLKDEDWTQFYHTVSQHPLMHQFHYNDISSNLR